MEISLVIPFYNEEAQINKTLSTVVPVMEDNCSDFEVLCIDDGSSDRTWEILTLAHQRDPHIRALKFSRNFGKEAAICAGLEYARGDAVILMDGDLQHPPRYIPQMIKLWHQGYDVVEGVKTDRGDESKIKRFFAKAFYKGFEKISNIDLDNASDFKLLDREVVDAWNQLGEHNTFFRALSEWLGFKRIEFNFVVDDRENGESKWKWSSLWRLGISAITSFSTKPLMLITWIGVIFFAIAIVIGLITIVRYFMGNAMEGFTTVILLLLIIGGSIMLSLGLIGMYIAKIYTEVKGRPRFLVMDQTDENQEDQ